MELKVKRDEEGESRIGEKVSICLILIQNSSSQLIMCEIHSSKESNPEPKHKTKTNKQQNRYFQFRSLTISRFHKKQCKFTSHLFPG